jgi:hypothetical protein
MDRGADRMGRATEPLLSFAVGVGFAVIYPEPRVGDSRSVSVTETRPCGTRKRVCRMGMMGAGGAGEGSGPP